MTNVENVKALSVVDKKKTGRTLIGQDFIEDVLQTRGVGCYCTMKRKSQRVELQGVSL